MKNIWIINHYATKHSIAQGRHHLMSLELSKRGFRVVLICSSLSHPESEYLFREKITVDRINSNYSIVYLKHSPKYKKNGLKRIINMISFSITVIRKKKYLRNNFSEPDVIISSSPHSFNWLSSYFLSKKYRAKFFVEVRDLWPLTFTVINKMKKYHPLVIIFYWIEKFIYKRADIIFSTLPNSLSYFRDRYNVSDAKITILPQMIDCQKYLQDKDRYATEIDNEVRKFVADSTTCVFTGNFDYYEGIYFLIDVAIKARDISNLKFLFIGSGKAKDRIESKINEYNLTNTMVFRRVPRNRVPSYIDICDICIAGDVENIYEYRKFGLSLNKLNDYLMSGKPTIIATDAPNALTGSDTGIILKPNDIDEYIGAIKFFKEFNNDQKELYALNSREYVEHKHDVSVVVDIIEKHLI